MYMYTQTVEERYSNRKMEKQTCKLLRVTDWKGIEFCLRLNPSRVDGWGIHLDEDKVNKVYDHVAIFEVVTLTDRWQCTGLSEVGFICLEGSCR